MYAFRRPLHQSWLLACLFFGIVIGSIGAFLVEKPVGVAGVWLASAGIIAILGCMKRRVWFLFVMVVAGAVIGAWRVGNYRLELAPYGRLTGHIVTLEGKVADDADTGTHGDVVLRLSGVAVEGHRLKGKVWISVTTKAEVKRGDIVTVKGKLATGFGSFAASMYRAELVRAERPEPGDVALKVRDWFSAGVRKAIPEPEASLGVGFFRFDCRHDTPDTVSFHLLQAIIRPCYYRSK